MLLAFPTALAAGLAWPDMLVSATNIDLGLVPIASTATGAFTVTNAGDLPMGLRAEIAASPASDFSYTWDHSTCDDGTALLPGVEWQVGANQGDWSPPESGSAEDGGEPGAEAILPPGCTVTFNVAYTPTTGANALAALILTASGDYPHGRSDFQLEVPSYAEDPLELRQVVALTGATDGAAPDDSRPALLAIDASPDVCREGDKVALQAWTIDPDGGSSTYSWGVDNQAGEALFNAPFSPTPTYTCPEVETPCGYDADVVYLLVQDVDGHQAWAQTTVYAIDSGREHADVLVEGDGHCHQTATPAGPPGPERRCECGESAAALPLGVVWALAWRWRRRPSV